MPCVIRNSSSSTGKLQRFHTSQGTNIHKFLPIRPFGYAQGRLHTATTFNNYTYIKIAALTSRKKQFVFEKTWTGLHSNYPVHFNPEIPQRKSKTPVLHSLFIIGRIRFLLHGQCHKFFEKIYGFTLDFLTFVFVCLRGLVNFSQKKCIFLNFHK